MKCVTCHYTKNINKKTFFGLYSLVNTRNWIFCKTVGNTSTQA